MPKAKEVSPFIEGTKGGEVAIFIDASYFVFYRFFALTQWWKVARPEDPLDVPIENEEFVEKFKSTFVEKVAEIPKKLGINVKKDKTKVTIYVARDCPRRDIWRMNLFPKYKANRNYDGFQGGPFFQMAYDEQLFEKGGAVKVFRHPKLEADDCIALAVRKYTDTNPDLRCIIMGSDQDYLQLVSDRVNIFNLKYKNIAEGKTASYDAKRNLFIKIVMGDTSDNIPACFPKCGFKTATRCYEEPEFFEKKKTAESDAIFKRNNQIINFDFIPEEYANELPL
jgi:5'-3' exonuclease